MTSMDQYTSLARTARRAVEQAVAVCTKSTKMLLEQTEWMGSLPHELANAGERYADFLQQMADLSRRYANAVGSVLR